SSIIISGHSDGGAYAAWILKNHNAEKGLTFSAPSTRLNIPASALASTDFTHASTQCTAADAPPHIWAQDTDGSCDFPSTKLRTLLAFGDPAYDSSGGADVDGRNQHGNLSGPCVKTGPARAETKLDTTVTSCAWIQANATEWLTLTNAGAGHGSTVMDAASIPNRTCIWDQMLNQ
ncbi:MAG TPA: hypothetical protein VGO00_16825, partial [Kofleriaceae bacterium]|nr:hypothetical protein [Kofleriaceae bacterium]